MRKNGKWLIGATIIGLAIVGLAFLNIGDNLVYFYTPDEALAKAETLKGKTIRVGAMVKNGTLVKGADPLDVEFVATDFKDHEIKVKYRGIPPDMFKEGQGVVAEGRFLDDSKTLLATSLLVKHSEEYRKPDDQHPMDAQYLKRSMFGTEMQNSPPN